eukprot:11001773-Lingulodinium_polyedra.AAC.1
MVRADRLYLVWCVHPTGARRGHAWVAVQLSPGQLHWLRMKSLHLVTSFRTMIGRRRDTVQTEGSGAKQQPERGSGVCGERT